MATKIFKPFLPLSHLFSKSNILGSFQRTNERNSSYNPHFVDPVFRKPDLKALKESGEAKKIAHVPIKAAKSEHTCSEFYDPRLEKFVNYVMRKGKKDLARKLVNKTLEVVKRTQVQKYNKETDPEEKAKIKLNALEVFHEAVNNCKPVLQLTPIKRGGHTYQVPVAISDKRAQFLSMNWLILQGKAEPKTEHFPTKLAKELIQASLGQGKTVKRKEDLHKQCEANRAYAHYRWG